MHEMKLDNKPFELIKNGSKTIEMRLYDEKRQSIKIGDIIEFTNRLTEEKIKVEVLALHKFANFTKMYANFNKVLLGYKEDEEANPLDMEKYYSKEEQTKYGVVGIEIKKI